jgi:hypothetical protein
VPQPQAAHMTASDLPLPTTQKLLASRGPSTHDIAWICIQGHSFGHFQV